MKVDAEGYQTYAVEGGKRLLHEGHVENIITYYQGESSWHY
jgi:hypothetical protein